jgi:hypothetical protein
MSGQGDLYWRPAPEITPPAQKLPNMLRHLLVKRYGFGANAAVVRLDIHARDYLLGLHDAGIEGAHVLYTAIDEYGAVEVWVSS